MSLMEDPVAVGASQADAAIVTIPRTEKPVSAFAVSTVPQA